MRCKILLAFFICVALLNPLASWAQDAVISGKVTDEAGEPLPGANVSIQLTNLGAATDVNGEFEFTVPASALQGQEVELQVRFIGYRTKTEKVTLTSEGATVDFALRVDVLDMDAIIVTGVVEETPKTKMAFSIGRVSAEALEKVTVSSVETALRGKVAGVKVVQGSGKPGTDASILLRGATSINSDGRSQDPLYIVDGVIIDPSISGSPLSDINSDDIETIEVIKGAAGASLYGSRAANGVVNITMNRGKNLGVNQTRIRIRNEFGFNQLRKDYPTRTHHFFRIHEGTNEYIGSDGVAVTPGDFIDEVGNFVDPRSDQKIGDRYTGNYDDANPDPQNVSNIFFMDNDYKWITTGDILVDDLGVPLIDPATNQPVGLRLLPGGQTINQVQQFFDPGTFISNSVSLSRNMENTNFSVSFSNRKEDGVIGGLNGYERKTVRMGIDHQFKKKLSISASAFYSTSSQDNITEGVGSPFFGLVFHAGDIDLSARHAAAGVKTDIYPDGIPIDIGGQLFSSPVRSTTPRQNPLYETFNNDRTDDRTRFMGGATLSYRPVNWAKLEGSLSYDRSNRELFRFWDIGYDNEFNSELLKGLIQKQPEFDEAVNGNLTASFQKAFWNNEFTLRAKARALFESAERQNTFAEGADLAVRNTPDLNVASSLKLDVNSRLTEVRSQGYSFITGMDFKDRYIADVLVRRDGSSLFGPDERWHNYFRASGAWRLSQESWWFSDNIQEFKLRGSYGTAGGRPNFFARFETWNVVDGNVTKNTLGNKELKPEFSKELELGVDMAFLDKFSLEVTRAKTVIEDQLLLVPFAGFAGYTDQWQNAATLETNTWEFSLNSALLRTRDMSLTVGINIDRTRATVTKLDVPAYNWSPRDTQGVNIFRVEAGLPLGTLYSSIDIRSIDDLLLRGVTQDQLNQFQINDEGYVVWVGGDGSDANLWMKGIDNQLWGTRATLTLTDGPFGARTEEFAWGNKIFLKNLIGENENTQFVIGDTTPDFNWSVFSNLTWKGFNLYTLFDAQVGGDIFSQTVEWGYGVEFAQEEADQSGKDDALKKPTTYFRRTSDGRFVFDGSYVKLRELALRYTFKRNQLQGIFGGLLNKISVGVIGRNLLTWDNYDQGYDPEVGVSTRGGGGTDSNAAIAKIDSFQYPNFRTYSGFLEFQF